MHRTAFFTWERSVSTKVEDLIGFILVGYNFTRFGMLRGAPGTVIADFTGILEILRVLNDFVSFTIRQIQILCAHITNSMIGIIPPHPQKSGCITPPSLSHHMNVSTCEFSVSIWTIPQIQLSSSVVSDMLVIV
jgi:hypothetical protein